MARRHLAFDNRRLAAPVAIGRDGRFRIKPPLAAVFRHALSPSLRLLL
jgi:hypothetical protein